MTTQPRHVPLPSPPYLHSLASVAVLNEALCVQAACFTYVMHLAMTYYRSSWGKDNLAKKTLVDARFLTT